MTADGFWEGKTVFVTGGTSFIGSTLTDHLLARGAKICSPAGFSRLK
jgi:nucleoside-diphosphate-sugar epimerase